MIGDIKNIFVIESLSEKDGIIYTGESLYNDYIKRRIEFYDKDFRHEFSKVSNKVQLIDRLKFIETNSPYMMRGILIHLDMHGDEELNGLILSDKSLVTWEELAEQFRPINITSKNNLFITMGTCNGRFLYKGVNPYKKSPYSATISANKVVSSEEVYEKFGKLFEELIDRGNLIEAYLEMEKSGSSFYYKDSEKTFEEAYKSVRTKLSNNSELKKQILEEANKATGVKLSDKEEDFIFRKALFDMYLQQKAAFDFTDN